MASNTLVEEAKADIEEKGFHKIDDSEIGTKIAVMRDSGLSFYMHHESGFQFCRDHVLLNEYIQNIINALSSDAGSRYLLAHQGSLAAYPNHIWSSLKRSGGATPLWEAAPAHLENGGYKAESVSFEHGGFVICDARIFFERHEERTYIYTYVTSSYLDQLEQLPKEKHRDIFGVQQLPASCDDARELEKLGIYRKR
ncbi:uncharacterized protein FFB20_12763 [Fusarium fujikuroi]|nr:uncharacterized protein FFC1_09351 [Fusarium fujikuroi]SCO07054.1 uncharacterized protein FFB20_12763 [Fusarium fujikuroi]SCO22050.1 uncharacterized protein FFE2_15124 [Fusarium fujikuroi]SCO35610.1 uncharacterized protein FFNC_04626 [Fusarium fujikuroi]SCV49976.1 uncharacterized protein FFFS_09279 [Fusarium fujikuroi]